MIDLKLLQKDFDTLSTKLARKGVDASLMQNLQTKNEELNGKEIKNKKKKRKKRKKKE